MDDNDTASPLGSVDKALRTLEVLADAGATGLTLASVAAAVGANKTTLHRTLAALAHRGFAEHTSDGAYRLGPAATALGATFLAENNLPALLRPALVCVCEEVQELVHLGTLVGREVTYLDKVEPARAIRVWSAIGRRMPAATTALGRALLSQVDPDPAALAWYAASAADPAGLRTVLDRARADGYASETEENEPGIACVAICLLRGSQPLAAVSVTAPVERMPAARRIQIVAAMRSVLPDLLPAGVSLPG